MDEFNVDFIQYMTTKLLLRGYEISWEMVTPKFVNAGNRCKLTVRSYEPNGSYLRLIKIINLDEIFSVRFHSEEYCNMQLKHIIEEFDRKRK